MICLVCEICIPFLLNFPRVVWQAVLAYYVIYQVSGMDFLVKDIGNANELLRCIDGRRSTSQIRRWKERRRVGTHKSKVDITKAQTAWQGLLNGAPLDATRRVNRTIYSHDHSAH